MVLAMVASAALIPSFVFAKEIPEGTVEISGSTNGGLNGTAWQYNYSSGRVNSYSVGEIGFSTTINYFLTSQVAIGVVGSYDKFSRIYHSNAIPSDITHDESYYGIGPSLTLQTSLAQSLNAFVSANVGLSHGEYTETNAPTYSSDGSFAEIALGLANFIGESAAINTAIFYHMANRHAKFSNGSTYDYNYGQFGLGLGVSVYIK